MGEHCPHTQDGPVSSTANYDEKKTVIISPERLIKAPDVRNRVHELLHKHLGVPYDKINDDAELVKDLGADSLDGVELIMVAEEEFDIDLEGGYFFENEDRFRICTVKQVVERILDKVVQA